MTLEEFKQQVIEKLGKSNTYFSYCPMCYCLPAISNSHTCEDFWMDHYRIGDVEFTSNYMKKNKHEKT